MTSITRLASEPALETVAADKAGTKRAMMFTAPVVAPVRRGDAGGAGTTPTATACQTHIVTKIHEIIINVDYILRI